MFNNMNRFHIMIFGAGTYVAAVAAGYLYANSNSQKSESRKYEKDQVRSGVTMITNQNGNSEIKLSDIHRNHTYSLLAPTYDSIIGYDEIFMGLTWIRWYHLSKAKGDVLEVGCGTGRNFSYYNFKKVITVAAIDYSSSMIKTAADKLSKLHNNKIIQTKLKLDIMDAHKLNYPDDSFDTVIDTFGLCSYEDPDKVLKEMSRVCKKTGKILLIEHGKGSYNFINKIINQGACQHAEKWGCIWNKDIEKIVVSSGLEITSCTRWHFGTTYVIEAKPCQTI